jgi:hypothetical protein
LRELEGGDTNKALEVEFFVDGLKEGSIERGNVSGTRGGQGALDSLNTVEGKVAGDAAGNLDITVEILAGVVAVQVALATDANGITVTAVCDSN